MILDFVVVVNNVNTDFLVAVVHQVYVEQSSASVFMQIGSVIRTFVNHANVVN